MGKDRPDGVGTQHYSGIPYVLDHPAFRYSAAEIQEESQGDFDTEIYY